MNHIKYKHLKKLREHLTNDNFQSPYIGCNSKEINNQFLLNIIFKQIRCNIMLEQMNMYTNQCTFTINKSRMVP